MAKISVIGRSVVIESSLSFADLELVKKYRKPALVLMDGEDNKTPVFEIGVVANGDCVSKYGATFGSANASGNAMLTVMSEFATTGDALKEEIADKFGSSLMNIAALEKSIPVVVEEIRTERARIISDITVA